jgi:hypothetical protein
MERNGAAHRILGTKPQQVEQPTRGMRPANQWNRSGPDESYSHEDSLALSVSRHPSGGHVAEVANYSWDPQDPDVFRAGPFRTPNRARVAAESLGNRTTSIGRGIKGDIDSYRRPR